MDLGLSERALPSLLAPAEYVHGSSELARQNPSSFFLGPFELAFELQIPLIVLRKSIKMQTMVFIRASKPLLLLYCLREHTKVTM